MEEQDLMCSPLTDYNLTPDFIFMYSQRSISDLPIKTFHAKCKVCGTHFTYESKRMIAARSICSHECRRKHSKIQRERKKNQKFYDIQFVRLLEVQGNKCAVCGATDNLIKDYNPDGTPRGHVCHRCAGNIQKFESSLPLLESTITYLSAASVPSQPPSTTLTH